MRFLIFLFLVLISTNAFPYGWNKHISCNKESVVIDSMPGPRGDAFQVVIRNNDAVEHLLQRGAINYNQINGRGEYIYSVSSAGTHAYPGTGNGDEYTTFKGGYTPAYDISLNHAIWTRATYYYQSNQLVIESNLYETLAPPTLYHQPVRKVAEWIATDCVIF